MSTSAVSPQMLSFHVAGCTDTGCLRADNQDAWLADAEHGLFIVADGIAGRPAGAKASQFVTSALPRVIARRSASLTQRSRARAVRYVLRESILEVGREMRKTGAGEPELTGLGTTIVAVWLRGPFAHVAHMGDSRAYLLRGGITKTVDPYLSKVGRALRARPLPAPGVRGPPHVEPASDGSNPQPCGVFERLTEDHSLLALLRRNGEITEEEARGHPAGGSLTRFVGMDGDVHPDTRSVRLELGDRLLLCTDGLWSAVPDDELQAVLSAGTAQPQTPSPPVPEPTARYRAGQPSPLKGEGVPNRTLTLDVPSSSPLGGEDRGEGYSSRKPDRSRMDDFEPEQACRELVEMAKRQGGRDNITAVVVSIR